MGVSYLESSLVSFRNDVIDIIIDELNCSEENGGNEEICEIIIDKINKLFNDRYNDEEIKDCRGTHKFKPLRSVVVKGERITDDCPKEGKISEKKCGKCQYSYSFSKLDHDIIKVLCTHPDAATLF